MYFLKQTVLTEKAEEAPPAEETDAQPVKRAAEEEEVGCLQQSHTIAAIPLQTQLYFMSLMACLSYVLTSCLNYLANVLNIFPSGKSGDKKAEDRGKWRFKRGRSGGLDLCYCLQHCFTSLVNIVL